jgi:proteasome lid subunit RPN8/RPN11
MKILRPVSTGIMEHAKQEAPIEACGYLAAKNNVIIRHYPLTNIDKSQEHFSLDPKEQFDALRKIRSESLTLAGVYHSHPVSPARPSEEDIKLANDPNLSYVIVTLASGAEGIRSFWIKKGEVKEDKIEIMEE